MHFDSLQYMSV